MTDEKEQQFECCESERPVRKIFCQKGKGHKGSCRAIVWWER